MSYSVPCSMATYKVVLHNFVNYRFSRISGGSRSTHITNHCSDYRVVFRLSIHSSCGWYIHWELGNRSSGSCTSGKSGPHKCRLLAQPWSCGVSGTQAWNTYNNAHQHVLHVFHRDGVSKHATSITWHHQQNLNLRRRPTSPRFRQNKSTCKQTTRLCLSRLGTTFLVVCSHVDMLYLLIWRCVSHHDAKLEIVGKQPPEWIDRPNKLLKPIQIYVEPCGWWIGSRILQLVVQSTTHFWPILVFRRLHLSDVITRNKNNSVCNDYVLNICWIHFYHDLCTRSIEFPWYCSHHFPINFIRMYKIDQSLHWISRTNQHPMEGKHKYINATILCCICCIWNYKESWTM